MKKIFLLVVLLLTVTNSWSQRSQIIAYIDMEYILENVPEYIASTKHVRCKSSKVEKKLRRSKHDILKS